MIAFRNGAHEASAMKQVNYTDCCDLRIKFTDRLRLLIMRVRYGVTKGYASMLSGVNDDSEFPMESIALATVTV